MHIFFGNGQCSNCHFGPSLSDHEFHVVLGRTQDRNGQLDRGRGAITNRREDNFKFATPTLRDIGKRGPFFHAGQARDLDGVVDLLDNPPQGSELRRLNETLSVQVALNALSTATSNYESSVEQLDAAREYFNLINGSYAQGVSSQIEFIDASNQLTRAELQVAINQQQVNVAIANLERETATYPLHEPTKTN